MTRPLWSSRRLGRVLGAGLVAAGLVVNPWLVQYLLVRDGTIDRIGATTGIVSWQLACILSGVIVWRFTLTGRVRMLTATWMVFALVAWWVLLIQMPYEPYHAFGRVFGLYAPGRFGLGVVVTYLGFLIAYWWSDRRRVKERGGIALLNAVAVGAVIILLEIPALVGAVDFRTMLRPREVGGAGPHNRVPHEAGFFHRPPGDAFTVSLRGAAAIISGRRDAPVYPAEHRYDRNGFRNRDDRDAADVILTGDSFIEGPLVTQDSVVSAVLERAIGKPVYNLGQADFGVLEEAAALRTHVPTFRPDVVVWFIYEGNDLFDFTDRRSLSSASTAGQRSLWRNLLRVLPAVTPDLTGQARPDYPAIVLADSVPADRRTLLVELPPPPMNSVNLERLAEVGRVIEETIKEFEGVRFVIAFVPTKTRVYAPLSELPSQLAVAAQDNQFSEQLALVAEQAGAAYVDLTDTLSTAAAVGVPVYYADDAHWSSAGHRVVAAHLVHHVNLGQPGGDGRPR